MLFRSNVDIAGAAVTLDVFTGINCANTLYTGISAGSTDASGNYSFLAGGSPLGTYSVIAHTPSPLGTVTSNCTNIIVQGQVATGTLDSADSDGITASLPLAGSYEIDVSGTWQNGPWWLVDPEFVQQMDGGGNVGTTLTWLDSWPGFAPADFGDVMVNSVFIDWGTLNETTHAYSHTGSYSGSVNLAVFDSYYGDNDGSLNYTITYVGP